MHNIHELEQRWFRYKLKSYLPYFITLVFSGILAVALILILDTKQNIPIEPIAQIQENKKIDNVTKNKVITKQTPIKQEVKSEVVQNTMKAVPSDDLKLAPSLDFMKQIGRTSISTYTPHTQYKKTQTPKKEHVKKKPVYKTQPTPKKKKVSISTRETQNDIQSVIKRFKKNNNPALSLFVAKKYYKLGDYKKSYDYALITNKINNDIEQSWIIFAKSLVKLNKKDLAIKTLNKYINHSHSGNAKVLLDDIKSGKFR